MGRDVLEGVGQLGGDAAAIEVLSDALGTLARGGEQRNCDPDKTDAVSASAP
jgi:hypothetical protein